VNDECFNRKCNRNQSGTNQNNCWIALQTDIVMWRRQEQEQRRRRRLRTFALCKSPCGNVVPLLLIGRHGNLSVNIDHAYRFSGGDSVRLLADSYMGLFPTPAGWFQWSHPGIYSGLMAFIDIFHRDQIRSTFIPLLRRRFQSSSIQYLLLNRVGAANLLPPRLRNNQLIEIYWNN